MSQPVTSPIDDTRMVVVRMDIAWELRARSRRACDRPLTSSAIGPRTAGPMRTQAHERSDGIAFMATLMRLVLRTTRITLHSPAAESPYSWEPHMNARAPAQTDAMRTRCDHDAAAAAALLTAALAPTRACSGAAM